MFNNLLIAVGLKEKPSTAASAKERLQVVVSHQRRHRHSPDYLPMLEKDILAVIAKYVEIEEDKVDIKFQRGDSISTLEVNVELPAGVAMRAKIRKIAETSEDVISAKGNESKKKAELFDA